MKTRVETEVFTKKLCPMAADFQSGNSFLDNFIKSEEALNDSIGKTFVWLSEDRTHLIGYYNIGMGYIDAYNGDDKYKIGGSVHLNFFAVNGIYRGISFVTLAATQEGYSLYKRHCFEELDADLHFSFKDDEKGCIPMYLALDFEG